MSDHWVTSKDRSYFVNGEILRKGYISTDPKPSPYNRQLVYEDYLSVKRQNRDGANLWNYLVRPGKFPWNGASQLCPRVLPSSA
jgi:hypothetical protein